MHVTVDYRHCAGHGQCLADVCVVTTDSAEGAYVAHGLSLVSKRGRVVMTAIPHPTDTSVDMSLFDLTLYEKQVRGSLPSPRLRCSRPCR